MFKTLREFSQAQLVYYLTRLQMKPNPKKSNFVFSVREENWVSREKPLGSRACFSEVPRTFRTQKASYQTDMRLS